MSGAISATTLGIVAGVGAAGSIGGALISSNAANNAANTQAQAAQNAAQLQYQASQNALGFQKQQYNDQQSELAPWLQSGSGALSNLDYLLGIQQPSSQSGTTGTAIGSPAGMNGPVNVSASPNTNLGGFGSLMQAYPGGAFKAPSLADMQANDPGYQARLNMGEQALQQSAAARGNLLTGGTAQAINQLGQDYASNEYNNYYNQALNTYGTNYNTWNQQQTNQYNKLASLAGVGQQTAATLGTLGQNSANSISNNLLGTAANMGQQYNNAAAANASGMVGSANAWGGALNGIGGNVSQLMMMHSLFGGPSMFGSGPTNMGNLWNAVGNGNSQIMGTEDPTFGGTLG